MAKDRGDGIAAAFVLNDRVVDAGFRLERFSDQMREPTVARRRAVQLAGVRLTVSDEFRQRVWWNIGVQYQELLALCGTFATGAKSFTGLYSGRTSGR